MQPAWGKTLDHLSYLTWRMFLLYVDWCNILIVRSWSCRHFNVMKLIRFCVVVRITEQTEQAGRRKAQLPPQSAVRHSYSLRRSRLWTRRWISGSGGSDSLIKYAESWVRPRRILRETYDVRVKVTHRHWVPQTTALLYLCHKLIAFYLKILEGVWRFPELLALRYIVLSTMVLRLDPISRWSVIR